MKIHIATVEGEPIYYWPTVITGLYEAEQPADSQGIDLGLRLGEPCVGVAVRNRDFRELKLKRGDAVGAIVRVNHVEAIIARGRLIYWYPGEMYKAEYTPLFRKRSFKTLDDLFKVLTSFR